MALTDISVRALKKREKPYKVTDGDGLHLLVSPAGGKLWRLAYRFNGVQKQLAFGSYPDISLADARTKRDKARKVLAEGRDPAVDDKLEKLAKKIAAANTFDALADEYLAKLRRDGRAETTITKIGWLLDFARPVIGGRSIAEIQPAEVLDVIRRVEDRGRLETARRLRSTLSTVFRLAVATARAERDPAEPLRGALTTPKVVPRAAVTEPEPFGALLRAIDSYEGQPTTHAALRLLPLVFTRPGELRAAKWSEFDFERAVWTIPAGRTKMRREHLVPLARQAVGILKELQSVTGRCSLVFPSLRSSVRPISENTLNAALRRLGYSKEEVTAHGFRSSASTMLNEAGYDRDVIETALAHRDKDKIRATYNRASYWQQRVIMMQDWADRCDAMRDGAKIIAPQFGAAR